MNLRELSYIVAVAETLNFSRAAEQCHVSQPTLSAQIKKLEEFLGVMIFERNNRNVMLTDVGAEIVTNARRILSDVSDMQEIASAAQDPFAGKFRLGAFPTLAPYLYPLVLPSIRDELPKLNLVLAEEKTETLLEQLKKGRLDAAFVALPIDAPTLESHILFRDPFYLAVPHNHALSAKKSVSSNVLHDYSLLLLEEGHCLRDQALEFCQIAGAKAQTDYRATSLETLRQMVRIGNGITLMPKLAIHDGDALVNYIPFQKPVPHRTIGLVWRKTHRRIKVIERMISLFDDADELLTL